MDQGDCSDLKELQALWYAKLKEEGFQEIEDTSLDSPPLKVWHSFHFTSERIHARRGARERYQEVIEDFINREDVLEIATLSTNHFNTPLTPEDALQILKLHSEGFTERAIALQMKRSKTCIHHILERFRTWMKLL